MTAHKRRHTTQPFALCKLSYGMLLPNIQISNRAEDDCPLGRYGRMALSYLRENHSDCYTALKMNGSLMETMYQVQREATEQVERLPNKY